MSDGDDGRKAVAEQLMRYYALLRGTSDEALRNELKRQITQLEAQLGRPTTTPPSRPYRDGDSPSAF